MSQRFFSDELIQGPNARLTGPEAHHLLNVMRLKPGDRVVVFDGTGFEFDAEVTGGKRSEVHLSVLASREVDREIAAPVTLGVALPKGDRQKVLVEKCTELGVARLVPLETSRSVVQPSKSALEKLRRAVVEASKQCGRNRLMQIEQPKPLAEYLAECPQESPRIIAHPGPATPALDLGAETYAAVGPEGGFAEEEVAQAIELGWQAVSLGPAILRIETAAIALVARLSG